MHAYALYEVEVYSAFMFHCHKYTLTVLLHRPIKVMWLTYLLLGFTCTNSAFCPQSVFLWFLWISDQTAIISLHSSN